MNNFLILVAGAVGGFFVHSVTMKVSFKQRTIDNKIKVYDALISQWVKMRNFIYTHHSGQPANEYSPGTVQEFDQIYGESQRYIGEAVLVCEDVALTADINEFNEKMYRSGWLGLSLEQANMKMEGIKSEAIALISRMREDIKASTRFEWHDFVHMISGFKKAKQSNDLSLPTNEKKQ
jgi:hypothetical protein